METTDIKTMRAIQSRKETPWLTNGGGYLSDENLLIVSRMWTPEIWEQFLDATVDKDRSEEEEAEIEFKKVTERVAGNLFKPGTLVTEELELEIETAIKRLPKKRRKVIKDIFWNGRSVRWIAEEMRVDFSWVQEIKEESLKEIKALIENSPHTRSYLIGRRDAFRKKRRSEREQIVEVYLRDLRGSYSK